MLTIEDCIGLSELTDDEIRAIAQHEHIPEMAAVELGNYLLHLPDGGKRIRQVILDDIEHASRTNDVAQSAKLKLVLKAFIGMHPEASVRSVERE